MNVVCQQLPACTSQEIPGNSATRALSKQQVPAKQLCKHLLHTLQQLKPQQLQAWIGACSRKSPAGCNVLQLLGALLPQLQLPHPLQSLTITKTAYQLTERLLGHILEQQDGWQQAWQQAQHAAVAVTHEDDSEDDAAPDSQASRDRKAAAVNAAAAAAGTAAAVTQQQLLQQLHCCAALLWHARLHLEGDLQHAATARFSLQLHKHAHAGLQHVQAYCTKAGISKQVQQMMQQLLLTGTAQALDFTVAMNGTIEVVKQEQQTQPDQQHQRLPLLKKLERLLKATSEAQAKPSASSASSKAVTSATVVDAVLQMTKGLAVSGVQAWGLAALQLGPLMLDKSVGQPLLTVSQCVGMIPS